MWIDEVLQTRDEVISEATGSSPYLSGFLQNLKGKYNVKLVRINCPLDICFTRVKQRAREGQFLVTDEMVRSINATTSALKLDWDLEIENAKPAADDEIISAFNGLNKIWREI